MTHTHTHTFYPNVKFILHERILHKKYTKMHIPATYCQKYLDIFRYRYGYVCVHVCIYTHTYTHKYINYKIHAYVHTRAHTYLHANTYIHMHPCLHTHIHYLHKHIHTYTYTCIPACRTTHSYRIEIRYVVFTQAIGHGEKVRSTSPLCHL